MLQKFWNADIALGGNWSLFQNYYYYDVLSEKRPGMDKRLEKKKDLRMVSNL